MAALEAVILYIQLTLGIANPTSTDIQKASYDMYGTTEVTCVTLDPISSSNSTTTWDTSEGN